MSEVVLKQVKKRFGPIETIHGVDLNIRDGEFCVFVGPSGCGKSTLLRLIAGLEDISDGELSIGGEVVNDRAPKDRGVAMVFQSYALYPHMTVYENMAFGLDLAKRTKDEQRERVMAAARVLQLEELLDRKPKELSGGQRQRVAIGRAIVRKPKVFLFDEPLSNLDAGLRVQMRIELTKLHEKLKSTMIYVTHDQVEAMTMADKIVVLRAGSVEQVGTPLELYHHPQNQFVAGFIGSPKMNFVPAVVMGVSQQTVTVKLDSGKEVTLPVDGSGLDAGDRVTVGIRPEHCSLADQDTAMLSGTVEVVEHLGEAGLVYVQADGDELFVARVTGDTAIVTGSSIGIHARVEDCYLFDQNGQARRRLDVDNEPLRAQLATG
ncbi:multiple sugar transport system ATP-binding protein [Thalassospira xiamenensis M-5 = DSM 17429]|uniref:ABC transporter n=1 Tax=Thalassospira xiamenensis M-5 = DSM 17429 TaxID=1123366 RepID=A0AB72UAJ5_9PROT|nr:sn-glycerol-3-phosphate ABC transporter ATP-binding protein UgpC [Thalassospira xiamenensis]AJD51266.1 ABC transporter [Thalassospira xiamenensis M-5 = DSM 17429]SIT15302.1 multiple sugar transport system ATP-binding protein [Thalassospira xiamenensis M-5 = DSM 17429]